MERGNRKSSLENKDRKKRVKIQYRFYERRVCDGNLWNTFKYNLFLFSWNYWSANCHRDFAALRLVEETV